MFSVVTDNITDLPSPPVHTGLLSRCDGRFFEVEMKFCHKCSTDKSLKEFSKHKISKDGLQTACKACRKIFREKNKECISLGQKRWYEKNKDHVSVKNKKYKENNRGKVKAYDKKYKKENADKFYSYLKKYLSCFIVIASEFHSPIIPI